MKGINQAELEKKLDLVIQKLMNLGGPEDEKELEEFLQQGLATGVRASNAAGR